MDSEKCKRLQAAGWVVGDASDFLELTPAEAELVELKVQLALLVKKQRKMHNLSQDALAKKMGSSQSRVAKIESGDPSVSLDLIIRALLTVGTTRQELAQAIINSDCSSEPELVNHSAKEEIFADMKQFRESLSLKGKSLSQTVINARQEE